MQINTNKSLFLVLSLALLIVQKGFSVNIPEFLKGKTLIVVIPNEEEKIFSNMMDAIEDKWKYCPYKFMNVTDAKELYSKKEYVFLQIVTSSTSANSQSGSLNLSLRKGTPNCKKDINRMLPLSTYSLMTHEGQIYCTMDNVPAAATQRMYYYTSDFIKSLNPDKVESLSKLSREGNITYLCKKEKIQAKKDTIAKKTVLLIDKNDVSPTDTVDRVQRIRENLNMADLKVMVVDFEDIDLALKKKEQHIMFSLDKRMYSCADLEGLCFTPYYDKKETGKNKRRAVGITILAWVGVFAITGGVVAINVLLN